MVPNEQGVHLHSGGLLSYAEWGARLQQSFEKCFYVPLSSESTTGFSVNPSLVNRQGIYKDTFGSVTEWYECNFFFESLL